MSDVFMLDNQRTWSEETFRFHYGGDVLKRTMRCCSGMGEDYWCKNTCHFLVAEGIEHVEEDGEFPVFGIDCDVEVLCWGGDDVGNSIIEAYCRQCAAAMRRSRMERERDEEMAQGKRFNAESASQESGC